MAQLTISDYKNNLFSNHFLEERIQDRDEWQKLDFEEKFDELKEFYQEKEGILSENLNEDQTQDNFIDPILRKLGHDWVTEASKKVGSRTDGKTLNPDYAFMNSSEKLKVHQDNEDPLELDYAVGDAKAWNRTLDKSSQDHTNPAFQIYNYVDRLRADWGLLTNGKKWRLYSYEDCAADIYFEIDLENLLAGEKTKEKLESFKYFYLLFRAESFENGFLEEIYRESVNFAEGLEDDLEDKVYNALEVAVEGFFETNDIEKTLENIDLVHHASLIFLYRILFILNAESRDLLPTEYEAYKQAFGLTQLKRMIIEENVEDPLFQETTVAWDNRISRLFEGIDDGYDLNETEIPAYNGGLFDEENGEENHFLAENKLYGTYLKEILELLATSYDEEKEKRIILDYKDLNIRHLGSVYEGLLEHKFKAADERKVLKNGEWQNFSDESKDWEEFDEEKRVEENELYLTNESGERKATGSYYTPEYIVEYIVENTVGPKVEEKISEAEENDENILPKVLELNVCDPAMGSGHFLTEATEFIAESLVEHADLKKQDIDENEDELNWAKRQVVQNCIYGVDINPLAVELGKLSLWIETMAEGKPLNFLDHHLKHGNSLIGSDFDEILSHPSAEEQKSLKNQRFQFGGPEEVKKELENRYREIEQKEENTVEEIHEKEKEYKQFVRENEKYRQFKRLSNIHTHQFFEEDLSQTEYENLLLGIGTQKFDEYKDEKWFQSAQEDAENRNYFHWQLEFPKVFFSEQEGFDAVVGNPPYVNLIGKERISGILQKIHPQIATGKNDMMYYFIKKALDIQGKDSEMGYIVSRYFMQNYQADKLRNYILNHSSVRKIIDFGNNKIFPGVSINTSILIASTGNYTEETEVGSFSSYKSGETIRHLLKNNSAPEKFHVDLQKEFGKEKWKFVDPAIKKIINKTKDSDKELQDYFENISKGVTTGRDSVFVISNETKEKYGIEEEAVEPWLKNGQINRYYAEKSTQSVIVSTPRRIDSLDNYPNLENYLRDNTDELEGRSRVENWYNWRKGDERYTVDWNSDKIVTPYKSTQNAFAIDKNGRYSSQDVVVLVPNGNGSNLLKQILGVINSKLIEFVFHNTGKDMGGVKEFYPNQISPLPLLNESKLETLSENRINKLIELKREKLGINLNIQDYLGNYSDGKTLGDLYSPVEGLSEKVVSDTSADRDSLRIGGVEFEERNNDLVLKVSARYKPEDSENIDEDELDRWGYFETEKVPAMKFNVDDKMRPLIEEFVSLAVDEAGGFAGFRESATKTNSIVDRLEKLTLPKLEDVEQGLEKLIENREEAEKLEEEIQETDELIDAIVFDLYDLTEEEVETVLDSLDTSEDEKERILEKFDEV